MEATSSGYNRLMSEQEEITRLRAEAREDRKLFDRAARAFAEIDRDTGLSELHADVLAALRIRVEGKERASLEDLLSSAGGIAGKRDIGDVLGGGSEPSEWPAVEDKKREWPGA